MLEIHKSKKSSNYRSLKKINRFISVINKKEGASCITTHLLATFFSEGFGYDFFLPFEAGDGVSSAALPFRIISCYRTHTSCIVRDGKCEGVGGNFCRGCLSFIAGFA